MEDLHKIWPHRWLSSKAEPSQSLIQGSGVFAKKKIYKGESVGVLGGVVVHKNQIKKYWQLMTHVGIQIDDSFFIVPTTREELEKHGVFNHSCEPNIGFSNSITFVTIKDIEPGQELVFDYAFCETLRDSFTCRCGTKTCRKKISPEDWKSKKIQEKYKKFFSPYLKDKISNS
ncbi:SET domain-containing protein [Patescibacteria group bacterium]|nr:SET domain-containing protein [Patescibacteria group bacterium]